MGTLYKDNEGNFGSCYKTLKFYNRILKCIEIFAPTTNQKDEDVLWQPDEKVSIKTRHRWRLQCKKLMNLGQLPPQKEVIYTFARNGDKKRDRFYIQFTFRDTVVLNYFSTACDHSRLEVIYESTQKWRAKILANSQTNRTKTTKIKK